MIDKSELKSQTLFSNLTDAELDTIARKIAVEAYPKGKSIFQEGDPPKGIYLVKSGRVEISKNTPDGWKQTLAVLEPNRIFGELSIIEDRSTHGADATAVEAAEVYLVKAEDVKAFEQTETNMMYKIMRTIAGIACRKVRTTNETLIKLLVSY